MESPGGEMSAVKVPPSVPELHANGPPPQPWHLLGFRGYMAFAVVFLHSVDMLPQKGIGNLFEFKPKERLRCHRGVLVFFMLSSSQLTYNLLWTVSVKNVHWIAVVKLWGRYCVRRIFRIYPNYIAILLFIKAFPQYYHATPPWFSFWQHVTLQDAFGVFWTLPAELEYYCVIPLLVLLYKVGELADSGKSLGHASASLSMPLGTFYWRFRTLALLPFASIALYLSQTWPIPLHSDAIDPHLPPFFYIFFFGSVVAIVLYNMQLSEKSSEHTRKLSSLLEDRTVAVVLKFSHAVAVWALFCVFSDLFSLISWYNEGGVLKLAFERPSLPVYIAASLALIFLSSAFPSDNPGTWNHVMTSAPLLWAGKMSYALYLSHPIATKLVELYVPRNHPSPLSIVYSIAVLLAMFMQRYIEVPGANLGNALVRQMNKYLERYEKRLSTCEVTTAKVVQSEL